jgi:uncharacterized protein (UPF0332 family)
VNKAFDLRQRVDYRELPNITQEQVEHILNKLVRLSIPSVPC